MICGLSYTATTTHAMDAIDTIRWSGASCKHGNLIIRKEFVKIAKDFLQRAKDPR